MVLERKSWRRLSYGKLAEGCNVPGNGEEGSAASFERGQIWEQILFHSSSGQGFGTSS